VIANRILQWMEDPRPQLKDAKDLPVKHWNARLVVALASLHMEAAHEVYRRRDDPGDYRENAEIAGRLFDYVASEQLAPADLMARWRTAIGSVANADGQFWWAVEIFGESCTRHTLVSYLIACATTQETIATFPAHVLLGAGQDRDGGLPVMGVGELTRAIEVRNRYRAHAKRALEAALQIASTEPEARRRAANILILEGVPARAASLLEPLVENVGDAGPRERFLARLLLGRALRLLGDVEAAIEILRGAIEAVPSAQSARVALAETLHGSGRMAEAANVTSLMFEAPSKPPDPWGSYPYGQYWLPDRLFPELRAEARR
jgi:hypothetical protein